MAAIDSPTPIRSRWWRGHVGIRAIPPTLFQLAGFPIASRCRPSLDRKCRINGGTGALKPNRGSPVVIRGGPGFVGIVECHLIENLERVWAQVFLVNGTFITDDECHHACNAIFGRRSGKSKASDHCAFQDEIHLAQRRRRTLTFENLEVVTMVGFTFVCITLL